MALGEALVDGAVQRHLAVGDGDLDVGSVDMVVVRLAKWDIVK